MDIQMAATLILGKIDLVGIPKPHSSGTAQLSEDHNLLDSIQNPQDGGITYAAVFAGMDAIFVALVKSIIVFGVIVGGRFKPKC